MVWGDGGKPKWFGLLLPDLPSGRGARKRGEVELGRRPGEVKDGARRYAMFTLKPATGFKKALRKWGFGGQAALSMK